MDSLTPPPRGRFPTINTNVADFNFLLESPTSAPHEDIPSFRVSTPTPTSPSTPQALRSIRLKTTESRALIESKKLLAHVLGQLDRRNDPPSVFDPFESAENQVTDNNFGVLVETVKDAVKLKVKRREAKPETQTVVTEDESDEDQDGVFSTDATYGLMMQLKDVLTMSVAQGWHIFDDDSLMIQSDDYTISGKPLSPSRWSRNSLQPGGLRSRRSSSHRTEIEVPELLSLCITVLASVVLEECRYKITSPKPSRPPNALQALTLDIAHFLLHIHDHKPHIIAKIGFAMIPAFSTFPPEMHSRLLRFFERAVIRGMLDNLGQIQGVNDIKPLSDQYEEPLGGGGTNSPIISIHVDTVDETSHSSADSHLEPWPTLPQSGLNVSSTYAPFQSLSLYYLSSLIAPLLASILEHVDVAPNPNAGSHVAHCFCDLLNLIVEKKADAYIDILQIVAYHTSDARGHAVNILLTFWPRAVGHLTVSRPFVESYHRQATDHPHAHQFSPWCFTSRPDWVNNSPSQHDCRSCITPIHGFGLFCPLCMCAVHFNCYDYPEGNYLLQYAPASNHDVQHVAMYRFSNILCNRNGRTFEPISKHGHIFRPVNLFTLCLCFICRKPLWGCIAQGLTCASCMRFTHDACLSSVSTSDLPLCSSAKFNPDDMNIDWADLRRTCIDFHHEILQLSDEELGTQSFEDISIFHAIVWIQLQIIANGIALGSIIIMQNGKGLTCVEGHQMVEFELHRTLRWCEAHLSSGRLPCSNALEDYLVENQLARSNHSLMFDWSTLVYICSTMKSSHTPQRISRSLSTDLLNVSQLGSVNHPPDTSAQIFEAMPLSRMYDTLSHEFGVRSDVATRTILLHLNHLGLFDCDGHNPPLFHDDSIKTVYSVFPLPLGLDLSVNVETLVSAVEACLIDLHLSINEVGFLLLLRRLWPNGLASDYSLQRLTRSVVSWILAEDDNLTIILREFMTNQKTLPGVRWAQDPVSWPSSQGPRPNPSSSVNNGGDYIAARRLLLTRYAMPWLLALHNQGAVTYVRLIYEACLDTQQAASNGSFPDSMHKEQLLSQYDGVLRAIIKLTQMCVVFGVFDELFLLWLEPISNGKLYDEPMPSLSRLSPRETENSHPSSVSFDQVVKQPHEIIDPWRMILRVADENGDGLSRSLQWLCLFARSGVEIPLTTFKQFSSLVNERGGSLNDSLLLAKAILLPTWLTSMGRQELLLLLSELHIRLAPLIVNYLKTQHYVYDCVLFIRISLATCLLLYGCDRSKLIELHLIEESDIRGLPSRRKLNVRGSIVVDPIVIDPRIMEAIELYMIINVDDVSCLVAKFLHSFLMDSPYLESHEVDNFILRNGRFLARCAWQLYDIQRHEISTIRTSLLLRTLVVDSEPFRVILHTFLLSTKSWEQRLGAVTRLFRVILDVPSPAFDIEDRQWRSSTVDIFYYFFTAIWADESDEVRVAVHTFSSSLLPAHFDAISLCWNESLSRMPIPERIKLTSFLLQLRPHFPTWQVLSWDAILEALLVDGYGSANGYNGDSPAAADLSLYGLSSSTARVHTDSEATSLRVLVLLLSLQMIADGITIDNVTLLKIKVYLVQAIGFSDVTVTPSQSGHLLHVQFGEVGEIPEAALSCVNLLLPVLDACYSVEITPSAVAGFNGLDDRPVPLLVGSIFVDMFLAMFCTVRDLSSLPVLTVKTMLETLCIIIYKHDFESRALRHLQQTLRRAVVRALGMLSEDISYDLRQLALSVTQAFVKRWHALMGSIIYTSIELVAKLIISQHHHSQDVLTIQAKSFIHVTLTTYAQNGLFTNLLKRQLNSEIFIVLKQVTDTKPDHYPTSSQSLRELLLRDVLGRVTDNDQTTLQIISKNIQTYVEIVFHQGYSAELMLFVGQQLAHIARRTSEWAPDAIDLAPLLFVFAILIQHNKIHSWGILPYVDTVLRIILNRSNVASEGLSRLLEVTAGLYRRTQASESAPGNSILGLMFEILIDGLRLKARVLPFTLKSMLEAIALPEILESSVRHLPSLLGLVDPGIHFLQIHAWIDVNSENDFAASLAVAKMLLQAAGVDHSVIVKLSDHGPEKLAHTNLRIRSWNILVLAALLDPSSSWCAILFAQLSSFSYAYHAAMHGYTQPGMSLPESWIVDVNHAYIAIKLWLLLAQKASEGDIAGDSKVFGVWNEVWPAFEGLINTFDIETRDQSPTLETLVISSIADLFIFLRSLHTPITLHTSTHITTLNRLRLLRHGDTVAVKLTRALKIMSDPPPETSFDVMVNQAAKDIVAAEKLRVLESRVVQERRVPERYRREMRATT